MKESRGNMPITCSCKSKMRFLQDKQHTVNTQKQIFSKTKNFQHPEMNGVKLGLKGK